MSQLDEVLGIAQIRSLEDLQSPEAICLAKSYGIRFEEIAELREGLSNIAGNAGLDAFDRLINSRGIDVLIDNLLNEGKLGLQEAARFFAAEAIVRYERGARKTDFRLVTGADQGFQTGTSANVILGPGMAGKFTGLADACANRAELYVARQDT